MKTYTSFLLFASALGVVSGTTTLFIPGLDPQAITADIEGVDSSGHTTWRLAAGVPSGTYSDVGGLLVPTATLVEGATDAHFVGNDPTLGVTIAADCGISGASAVCTLSGNVQGEARTDVETLAASGFEVQFDGSSAGTPTATGTPTTTATGNAGTRGTQSPSAGSGAGSGGVEPTGSATDSVAPDATKGPDTNGAAIVKELGIASGVAALVVAFFL